VSVIGSDDEYLYTAGFEVEQGRDLSYQDVMMNRNVALIGHAGTGKTTLLEALLFRAGVSLEALKSDDFRLTLAADALRPSDNAEVVNVGGEFSWKEALYLRAGMKSLFLVDNEEGITLGAGARYELTAASSIGIDYGYEDFGIFGGIQSFSLSVTF
jgi:GTPase SAR1 family protein